MSKSTKLAAGAIAGLTVVGLAFGGSVAANAANDPAANNVNNYVAVGSDTLQDLYGAFANVPVNKLDSFKAFGSATITLVGASGSQAIGRPAGSGDGAKALSATYGPSNAFTTGGVTYNINQADKVIDIARSSSRPSSALNTTYANANLVYVPLARDAVSVAISGTSVTNLSTGALTALYGSGEFHQVAGTWTVGDIAPLATFNTQNPVLVTAVTGGAISGYQELDPKLPQAGSGTRSFFQTAIGVSTPATWVESGPTFPENDGRVLTAVGQVIPFSAGQWIAQKNGVVTSTLNSGLSLANIDGKVPFVTVAGQLTAADSTVNGLFGDKTTTPASGTFARDVYSVVAKSEAGFGTGNTPVVPTTAGLGKFVAKDLPGKTTEISNYGFLVLDYSLKPADYGWAFSLWAN